VLGVALPALAGPFEDAVAKFANDEFSDTEEAVGAIATSGNPLAYHIIGALQDGRLRADPDSKKVYVTEPDGKSIDAATGAPVDSVPDSAAAVRLNNRLRRTVEAALGGLTLLSPDPARRVQAAQSVFKTPDETMLPVIDGALQKETNKAAKLAFTEARAAILLFKEDATDAEKGLVVARAFEPLSKAVVKQIAELGVTKIRVVDTTVDDGIVIKCMKKDPAKNEEEALKDIYRRLRPGDPPTAANARALAE